MTVRNRRGQGGGGLVRSVGLVRLVELGWVLGGWEDWWVVGRIVGGLGVDGLDDGFGATAFDGDDAAVGF